MRNILLGTNDQTQADVYVPSSAFPTHFHLIGGTGKGKTTAIHTLLQPLLLNPLEKSCFFIIDRLGNFSQELLLWMSSRYCTKQVRKRLVYIQPSREDLIFTFNPLQYETPGQCYYKVERTTEIILRAWESVNIEAMPRLARWTFNAFMAAAQLGLTVSDCSHFLMPGSPYHKPLLNLLPPRLKAEWQELTGARNQEATRILDSSRNRLKPYFESDILRRIFGSNTNRLNVLQMMQEGRIVVIDLSPKNRLSGQLANTIGALIINEVLATVRNLPREVRFPTYLLLDEFQNFVGPDIEAALPELRQLGLRMILSHQSFSQLVKGDYDLTNMIFQAQSRMIFGVQGEDADILAQEIASITFDPRRIKEEIHSRRQRTTGHKILELSSWSEAEGDAAQWAKSFGSSWNQAEGRVDLQDKYGAQRSYNQGQAGNEGGNEGGSRTRTSTSGTHQTLVPEYEEFLELASRTYESFDEQKSVWARDIRNLRTGQALLRLVNDPNLYVVNVKRSTPGFLASDTQTIARKFPAAFERMDRMVEENYQSEFFARADQIDAEADERLQRILHPTIEIVAAEKSPSPRETWEPTDDSQIVEGRILRPALSVLPTATKDVFA